MAASAVSGVCIRLFQYTGEKGNVGALVVLVIAWEIYMLYLTAIFCEWLIARRKQPPK